MTINSNLNKSLELVIRQIIKIKYLELGWMTTSRTSLSPRKNNSQLLVCDCVATFSFGPCTTLWNLMCRLCEGKSYQ